jgi:hypothetical protein
MLGTPGKVLDRQRATEAAPVAPADADAAMCGRSTSRSVRYSRLRLPTVTFTEVGAPSRSRGFAWK